MSGTKERQRSKENLPFPRTNIRAAIKSFVKERQQAVLPQNYQATQDMANTAEDIIQAQ